MSDAQVDISGSTGRLEEALRRAETMMNEWAQKMTSKVAGLFSEGMGQDIVAGILGGITGGLTAGLLEGAIKSIGDGLHYILGLLINIKEQLVDATQQADEYERAWIRFFAVIKSNNNLTGMTVRELVSLQDQMAYTTEYSKKQIIEAEATLIRMGGFGKEVFTGAMQAAADFAALFHQDINSAATVVGRALKDPVGSMKVLKQRALQGTQAEEALIERMDRAGEIHEARLLRLKILQRELGEATAETMAKTWTGQYNRFINAWDQVKEQIGKLTVPFLKEAYNLAADFMELWKKVLELMKEFGAFAWFESMMSELVAVISLIDKLVKSLSWAIDKFNQWREVTMHPLKAGWRALFGEDRAKEPPTWEQPKGNQITGTFEGLMETWKRISAAAAGEINPQMMALEEGNRESRKHTSLLEQIRDALIGKKPDSEVKKDMPWTPFQFMLGGLGGF